MDWGRLGAGLATGGLSEAYNWYKQPGDDAQNATRAAGAGAQKTGQDANAQIQGGLQQSLGAFNPAQQQYQQMAGQMSGPGSLEQLYAKRAAGQDADYNNAYASQMQQGLAGIGQNSAYAGHLNSGGNATREGAFQAAMAGQRAGEMSSLAGAAQQQQQGRLGQVFGAGMGLGSAQSGLIQDATKTGTGYQMQGNMANLEAQLAAANIPMQQRAQLMQLIMGGINAGAAAGGAASGAKGK